MKRELGLLQVICVSSGVMISSGLFILPAIAYNMSGPAVIVSYLIGSLLIIPTILSKSELVTAMPITGGIYIFADRSMGPIMGCVGGLTAWISLAFKSSFSLIAMGIFVILLIPDVSEIQIKLISIGCCVVFTIVNIIGVKMSASFQTLLVVLLVICLIIYSIVGFVDIRPERYSPFAPFGIKSIFATAGLIFISFSGTTKVAAISGEVKNPGRNLPLGIFYSWGIVSLLYVIVVFVTVGLLQPNELTSTFTPISLAGEKTMGRFGLVLMTLAGLMAFISTGNAGLLAASRNPLAMSKDELLPSSLSKLSKKETPVNAILVTSGIMITVILFLDLETFVKTASALKLILFIIANLSVIFMREANIHHYRPKFKASFYPWAQLFGILSYGFLLTQMGKTPMLIVTAFIAACLAWYFMYARGKIKREYAMLYVIERVTGIKSTDQALEEELREILIERDEITDKWYKQLICKSTIVDITNTITPNQLARSITKKIIPEHYKRQKSLQHKISHRLTDPDIIIKEGIACLSVKVTGHRNFGMFVIKNKGGIDLIEGRSPIHIIFVVFYSPDEWNYHIHAVSKVIEVIQDHSSIEKCKNEGSCRELYQSFLDVDESR